MSIDERARHALYVKLEEVLGADEATTMMEHLPPVGWADVATKSDLLVLRGDLDAVEERLRLRIEAQEDRLAARIDNRIGDQTRTIVFSMAGLFIAFAGVVLGAVALG